MDPSYLQRYLDDPDRPLVLGQRRHQPSIGDTCYIESEQAPTSTNKPITFPRTESFASSSASGNSTRISMFSHKSSMSSRTTAIVSEPAFSTLTGHLLADDVDDEDTASIHDFDLPCLLWYTTDCEHSFSCYDIRVWISHSLSHFGSRGPPTHSMCIFCSFVFDSDAGHALEAWTERMYHIATHFEEGNRLERSRPDFHVITALYERGRLTEREYRELLEGDERPKVEGLVFRPLGYVPPARKEKREREARRENEVRIAERRPEKSRREAGGSRSSKGKSMSSKTMVVVRER